MLLTKPFYHPSRRCALSPLREVVEAGKFRGSWNKLTYLRTSRRSEIDDVGP
jgi:hypothetical protein